MQTAKKQIQAKQDTWTNRSWLSHNSGLIGWQYRLFCIAKGPILEGKTGYIGKRSKQKTKERKQDAKAIFFILPVKKKRKRSANTIPKRGGTRNDISPRNPYRIQPIPHLGEKKSGIGLLARKYN